MDICGTQTCESRNENKGRLMEVPKHDLPLEWAERWRREKERRKTAREDSGEGLERVNQELKWIVAFNDSRTGLRSRFTQQQRSGVIQTGPSLGETDETAKNEEPVHIYVSESYPRDVFQVLEDLWRSSILTDLTLVTNNGERFQVHSVILAAVSALIQDSIKKQTDDRTNYGMRTLSLGPEVHPVGLQAVVEFAYTGSVSPLSSDGRALARAAARVLGVPRLLQRYHKDENGTEQGLPRSEEENKELKLTLEGIKDLWTERVGCDVILDVGSASFHVHKVLLAASSDYFRGMFTSGMKESRQTRVAIRFQLAAEMAALIGCSYAGMISLSWDSVFEITCTALQLQFQPALALCLRFLREKLKASWCLDVASFAEAYSMSELLEEANDFILRNFWEVSETAKFQDLPAEKLLEIIRHDGLCVPTELAVFRAVVSWIETDPKERMGHAGALMTGVRFPLMTFREFREVRAINLRMECLADDEVELYGSALKEFGFQNKTHRVRHPEDVLVLVGGDRMSPDKGSCGASSDVWFANSMRSCTGLMKEMEWKRLGEMPDRPRFRHGVATLSGRLYVVGGCYFYTKDDIMKSAYSYDPFQNCWKRLADMLEFRSNFCVVAHDDRLYAIGGDKEINTNIDSVEMYNPETDSWNYVHPLSQVLSGHGTSVTHAGIFISGGFNSKYECLPSVFLYQPSRGVTPLADMASERALHCMEALQGHLYVAGGVCNLRKFYTDQLACEVYDPGADAWTALVSLPVPHVGAASAVLEEKIYVLGGYSQEDYAESVLVHRLEPCTQRWQSMGTLPGAVIDIRACLLRLPRHLRFS